MKGTTMCCVIVVNSVVRERTLTPTQLTSCSAGTCLQQICVHEYNKYFVISKCALELDWINVQK